MTDRFAKLGNLTRGAALVGLGLGTAAAAACTNESGGQPPPVTGSTAPAATPADPAASAAPGSLRRRFPVPNAVRRGLGDATLAPSDGGTPGSAPDAS